MTTVTTTAENFKEGHGARRGAAAFCLWPGLVSVDFKSSGSTQDTQREYSYSYAFKSEWIHYNSNANLKWVWPPQYPRQRQAVRSSLPFQINKQIRRCCPSAAAAAPWQRIPASHTHRCVHSHVRKRDVSTLRLCSDEMRLINPLAFSFLTLMLLHHRVFFLSFFLLLLVR